MRPQSNLRINDKRLWDSLMDMARIGATEKGGVCRLTLTDLDKESRDLFVSWCEDAGCTVTIDKMGNIFARRDGAGEGLAPVLVGSHLDSQPTGGKFDGALGVLAALEIVRTLNDLDVQTRHPIEIAMWTNEEGSRFAPAMIASGVFAGAFSLDDGLSCADPDGKTIGEELQRIGYAGETSMGGRDLHAFFELHIEQGPILEEEGVDIGVVTTAQGQRWYEIELTGVESHAGPTPMAKRKDALVGAALVIGLVNTIGHGHQPGGCATVGMIKIHPNSRNVIPGHVFLTVDFRHPDDARLAEMDAALRQGVDRISANIGLGAEIEQIFYYAPLAFDGSCCQAIRSAADRLGHSHRDIISGAGHDACHLAQVAPTAMVFVPCVDGISHNEAEDCKPEWVTAGAEVLMHSVLEKAGIVGDESTS